MSSKFFFPCQIAKLQKTHSSLYVVAAEMYSITNCQVYKIQKYFNVQQFAISTIEDVNHKMSSIFKKCTFKNQKNSKTVGNTEICSQQSSFYYVFRRNFSNSTTPPAADESSWRCKMATVAPVRPPVEMVKKVPTPLFSSTSFAGDRSHEN